MRLLSSLTLVVLCALTGSALAQHHSKKSKEGGGIAPLADKPPAKGNGGTLVPLSVACATPGASIFVDGDMIGISPMDLPVPVTPGDHAIKVTRLGFAPFIDVFSTKGKTEVKLEIELVPVAGVLHVKSSVPGARVLVDGKYVGDAPLDVEADVGPRAVQVSKGGYKDFFENVMAVAGQENSLDVKLEELPDALNPFKQKPAPPPRWYQKGWVWGVVAAGAVAVGGGAVGLAFGLQSHDVCSKSEFCFDASTASALTSH